MKTKTLFAAALATLLSCTAAQAQILRTTVEQGEVEGVLHEGHALYKGIPYAEAPVGNLRWKAPVKKAPWQGVYNADRWGDMPCQPVAPGQTDVSEDCLYLEVETPAMSKDDKLPVFVMIHGGGFTSQSYRGTQESFVREGIIYCSVEYRLGALGFMCHPDLAKEDPRGVSGNYGILDQIMALQWIHDNIAAFGGDPDKITIAGESAGGISVSILCASPLAKGLFRAAISESGGSFWPVGESRNGNTAMCTAKAAEQGGIELQKALGKKNLKQMRQTDPMEVIKTNAMGQFWPVVDGYAITDDQYKLYLKGEYNDVDILIGTNSDEGALFVGPMPVEAYQASVRASYGDWADRCFETYPASNNEEAGFAMADIFRDGSFAWSTYAWANLQRKTGKGRVYMYYFDQDSENTIVRSKRGGAVHVAEMPFIYGFTFRPNSMTDTDLHMQNIMSQYWINFTKTGDPNSASLPYWTQYEQGKPTVMIMKNGFTLGPVQNQKQMDFFEAFFQSKRR